MRGVLPVGQPNRTELRQFLTENGYRHGGLGWFIDALGFTVLLDRIDIAPTTRSRGTMT